MAASIRLLTGLTLMAAVFGGLEIVWPHWADDLKQGRVTRSGGMTREVVSRQPEHGLIAERMEARRAVLKRLASGELTLFQAAMCFHRLNNTPETWPDRGWRTIEGRCDGEKLCRQVLIWADVELRDWMPPSQVETLMCLWEAELAGHIACNGRVLLPEA